MAILSGSGSAVPATPAAPAAPRSRLPINATSKRFDTKLLLIGNGGVGKTYFACDYTQGPIHAYAFDPGFEKTALLTNHHPTFTVDSYIPESFDDLVFETFWTNLQADVASGFFRDLADQSGLLIIDSLTTLARACIQRILARRKEKGVALGRDLPMRIPDYGILHLQMMDFISVITALPCAVVLTAHLDADKDSNGNTIQYYSSMPGRATKPQLSLWFDEMWLLSNIGQTRQFQLTGSGLFAAKTRMFSGRNSINNITMQDVYNHVMVKPIPASAK